MERRAYNYVDLYGFQTDCGICAHRSIADMRKAGVTDIVTHVKNSDSFKNLKKDAQGHVIRNVELYAGAEAR